MTEAQPAGGQAFGATAITKVRFQLAVAMFAARLKDAVDLGSVRDELASVVQQALEPAHVSLWITPREELAGPLDQVAG